MKLAVLSQIRNESDIVPLLLRHLAALYDYAVLIDHESCDGTSAILDEACRVRTGWQYWRCDIPGYHQIAFTDFALRHLFTTTDADFVFIHDADEFLDVPDRGELERRLGALDRARTVGVLNWRNCVPDQFAKLDSEGSFWAPPTLSDYVKIVIPRAFFDATGGRARPTMGNHSIEPNDSGGVDYRPIGDQLHFPVRSAAQIAQKAVTGMLSGALRKDRKETDSTHWLAMVDRLSEGGLDEADLIGLIVNYGETGAERSPVSRAELAERGFTRRCFDFAMTPPFSSLERIEQPEAWQVLAALLSRAKPLDGRKLELYLEDGHLLAKPQETAVEEAADVSVSATRAQQIQERLRLDLASTSAELDAARREVAMLRSSWSFRLTAPLRALRRSGSAAWLLLKPAN
jgi:hypothetical protein